MSVQLIHDLVCSCRITSADGALLLQLRHELQWARRPWWEKAALFVAYLIGGHRVRA